MRQKNVLAKNIFSKHNTIVRNGFNNKTIFDISKESIVIEPAMKSVHIKEHYFTNYLKSKKDVMYKFVKRQYHWILLDSSNIFDNFELKNVEFKSNLSKDKIVDIVSETFGHSIDLNVIYRLKSRLNPAFQLYINKINNNEFAVVIIDLYHLVIPASDRDRGKTKSDIKADYDRVSSYSYCLSNIVK